MEDQLHSLGDEHEEPTHVRVRHRDRTTTLDLIHEQRHDAAIAIQDVAEANGHERGIATRAHVLHEALGHPLGRAHDTHRVDGLVGRNQHEAFNLVAVRGLGHDAGAENVVLHGFAAVRFHQRHVLVRRSVKDDLGCETSHDTVDAFRITHASDDHVQRHTAPALTNLAVNGKQSVLVLIQHDEPGGAEGRHLSAEFGAYRTTGTCDEHTLAGNQRQHALGRQRDGRPRQEILGRQRSDLIDRNSPFEHVAQIRQHLDGQLVMLERTYNLA